MTPKKIERNRAARLAERVAVLTRASREALCEEIRGLIATGEPVHVRLVRLARSQVGLRDVTPQFMVLTSMDTGPGTRDRFYVPLLEGGVTCVRDGDEVHDMWRDVRTIETRVVRMGAGGLTPVDDAMTRAFCDDDAVAP